MEDQVASFLGITGATAEEARNFLEMAGGDLQQAVTLFMDLQAGTNGQPSNPEAEAEVRAPLDSFQDQIINVSQDQRKSDVLVEQDAQAMATRMQFDNEKGDSKPSVLNSLFAAPSFSEKKTWFECMQLAKESNRWIFVNIQDKEVFESHVLNRDVWSDETMQEIMNGNFVFWQRDTESVEGKQFCNCYKIDVEVKNTIPHLCVVDPRTGRLVKSWNAKVWDGPHVAADFLYSYLDRHSLQTPPSLESSKRSTPETSRSSITEVEPIAQRVKEDSPTTLRKPVLDPEPPKEAEAKSTETTIELPSVDDSKPVTQVQIRFRDGSKRAFQFNEEHLVADLYAVVASVLTGEFQICSGFPPKPITDRDLSLRTAGLCQSSVTVRQ